MSDDPLICPECRGESVAGNARIGNRRSQCRTCNAFAQRVMRTSRARLAGCHPGEYAKIKATVEAETYAAMLGGR